MTEEIIIEGVDVSKGNQQYAEKYSPVEYWYRAENNTVDGINLAECVHFTRQYDYGYCELSNDSCNQFQYNCVKNKNCYYKQLKRLEQENKELKEVKDKYYQQTLDDEILMNELSLEVDLRKKESDFYLEKLSKYRSALEEIKKSFKKICKEECDYTKPKFCGDCDCRYGQILNKINEVLG